MALTSLEKLLVLGFWDSFVVKPRTTETNFFECDDGSRIVLHNSQIEDFVFVEFQCQLTVVGKSISFGLLGEFLKFCQTYKTNIRVLRNNSEISSSFGAVFSDLKNSLPFKKASHLAENPNDSCHKKSKFIDDEAIT